jgi:uracil-DNA glycosylase family 4
MNHLYSELSAHIKDISTRERLLLFRGEEELEFLRQWISSKDEPLAIDEPIADNSLAGIVKSCVKCGTVENKKPGYGTGKNKLMIILNAPGSISRVDIDRLRDESKELLKKMLGAISVDIMDCYITNLIKCEAGSSFNRPGLMLKNCESILKREIQEIDPDSIIVMGDDISIKRMITDKNSIKLFKIEHPIMLIKNPALKKSAWATLQLIESTIKQ